MSDAQEEDHGPATGLAARAIGLSRLPLFEDLDEQFLAAIEAELTRVALPGGATLFRQGDPSASLYVLVYGRLAAIVADGAGERVVAQIGAGEVVGEMGLISGLARSATLIALRDCELLRLDEAAFQRLIRQRPEALLYLAKLLTSRLLASNRRAPIDDAPATIMLAPGEPGAPCRELAEDLALAIGQLGESVLVIDAASGADHDTQWFYTAENDHDRVIYVADSEDAGWTRRCLRQSDRILLVARNGEPPPEALPVPLAARHERLQPLELVLVDTAGADRPRGAGAWLERLPFELHCHIRLGHRRDRLRLARLVLRRAIGIALSGGGARGFTHIGVIRALREGGVPLDLFGGTSMGGVVGAAAALGYDDRQLTEIAVGFSHTKPFRDITLPVISLVRGRRISAALRGIFGDHRIEDTLHSYFCVSTNLTVGGIKVHRSGPVWSALRASIALPGLLPPMVADGEVLVDGAIIDNFPSDVMRQLHRGPVVGCDVSRVVGLRSQADALDERSLWWLLWKGRRQAPGIMNILFSAGTVGSDIQVQQCRLNTDILLEPPLERVSMLDWQACERAIEIGYRYTMGILEQPEKRRLLGLGV